MSLDALGLPADADQRAVKQAYARRLKAMRPADEDPAGFQHLHELYKVALAEVAWRTREAAEAAQPGEAEPSWADRPDAATTGFRPRGLELVDTEPRQPDVDPGIPPAPRPYEPALPLPPAPRRDDVAPPIAQETDEGFVIDANLLFQQMTENGARLDEARFRRWLAQTTGDWPIAAKPKVAPHVLRYLAEDTPDIDQQNLAAIIQTFGLDDVQTVDDPLALEQARQKIGALWSRRRHLEAAERLLRPDNRAVLRAKMKARVLLPGPVTGWIVEMLTGPNTMRWATISRFVPLLAWAVMRFLYALSNDRLDHLPEQIDRAAVERWKRAANFRHEIKPLTYSLALIALLAALAAAAALFSSLAPEPSVRSSSDSPWSAKEEAVGQSLNALSKRPADAATIAAFDKVIAENPGPWSARMEEIIAIAHFNKANKLSGRGDLAASRATLERIVDQFDQSTRIETRVVVSRTLVNLAVNRSRQGDLAAGLAIDAQVVRRYGQIGDPRFDLALAKALSDQTHWYKDLQLFAEARRTAADLHARFYRSTEPEVKAVVAAAPSVENGN